jgi:uncharacterized protein
MSTLVSTPQAGASFKALVQRHALLTFFVLAFGLSWPFLIADALGSHGWLPFRLPVIAMLLMSYGPTLAAIIVTGLTSGRSGVRALLGRLLIWRVGLVWYGVAIFGPLVLMVGANTLYGLLGGTPPPWPTLSLAWLVMVGAQFILRALVNGEEIGWRGFALPHLQVGHSALAASLFLGTVEALFHLPLFFTRGSSQSGMAPLAFLALSLGLATLFTWLFNNTQGSVPLAYLIHAAVNTWSNFFSPDVSGISYYDNHYIFSISNVLKPPLPIL